jgi:flagellar hook assembly protein FlgD
MRGVFTRALDPAVAQIYHNRLEQNFPNPFNPTTTLAFSIKDKGDVSLTIYDVVGRQVRELVNEQRERGAYKVVWDGQNDSGQTVASGVYFYKLVAGSFTDTKKMTILK